MTDENKNNPSEDIPDEVKTLLTNAWMRAQLTRQQLMPVLIQDLLRGIHSDEDKTPDAVTHRTAARWVLNAPQRHPDIGDLHSQVQVLLNRAGLLTPEGLRQRFDTTGAAAAAAPTASAAPAAPAAPAVPAAPRTLRASRVPETTDAPPSAAASLQPTVQPRHQPVHNVTMVRRSDIANLQRPPPISWLSHPEASLPTSRHRELLVDPSNPEQPRIYGSDALRLIPAPDNPDTTAVSHDMYTVAWARNVNDTIEALRRDSNDRRAWREWEEYQRVASHPGDLRRNIRRWFENMRRRQP